MDQLLIDALDVLVPEVERTTGLRPIVVDRRDWTMLLNEEGHGLGIRVNEGDSPAQRLAHLADQFQEWVVEELWRQGRPATWPECPSHPNSHPMQPAVVDGGAVWRCPKDLRVVAGVGELTT